MNVEQRLQGLEEEVKLLKNEIRAVLLDIKESLASGDWLVYSGPVVGGVTGKELEAGEREVRGVVEGNEPVAVEDNSGGGSPALEEGVKGSDEEEPGGEAGGGHHSPGGGTGEVVEGKGVSRGRGLEPLRLVLLLEWLERSERELGVEETERMVEVYVEAGGLDEGEKRVLKLLAGIMGRGSKVRGNLINRLMELDGLMRKREAGEVLEETVLKLISRSENRPDKEQSDLESRLYG